MAKTLRFAAGSAGGGYHAIAERYRDALARNGIDVRIVETSGSVENARLLAEGVAHVALLQGEIAAPDGTETLGAMFYEPLFVFARTGAPVPRNPGLWQGLTIAAGAPGSGTAAAFDAVERGTGQSGNRRLPLLNGAKGVRLVALDHIAAPSRRMPQAEVITLPAAGISFAPVVPAQDFPMLGMVAHLVADDGLHSSLVDRLVMAARDNPAQLNF